MLTRLFKQTKNFKCIGNKCIDSCCTGWDITFDQKTYEHLSQDPCFKKTINDYGYVNDHGAIPTINYGIINLTENNRCPFLDKDDLCLLQKEKGEDALSTVCSVYPRYYNVVDGVYEESLSLACIEAAEKLLLGDALELIERPRGPKRDVVLKDFDSQDGYSGGLGIGCLHTFRTLVFDLLKNKTPSFNEKLGMLMHFHQIIEELDDETLKTRLEGYSFEPSKTLITLDEATYERLIDFLKGIGPSGHTELDQLIDDCIKETHYDALKLERLSEVDQIMSNYLMHQMFKDLYPFIMPQSKGMSFEFLLKKVQLLRLLIAYDGDYTPKRVVRIIQMFSKGLEHHGGFHYELELLRL